MKKRLTLLCLAFCVFFASRALAEATQDLRPQIDALKLEVEQLQQQGRELQALVERLEAAMAPMLADYERTQRRMALRKRFEARSEQDEKIYTPDQIRRMWEIHLKGQNAWGTKKARKLLKQVMDQYPESNLAGCSVLYLGQMAKGAEKEAYLKRAIAQYGDCYYGDGVQVGAYATRLLSEYYRSRGETDKSAALIEELATKYPDAIDHNGDLLVESP